MGEKEENASSSVAKELFLGNILEERLFPYPTIPPEEQETLSLVLESIEKFMSGREDEYRKHDEKGEQPPEYLQSLRELGLFGLIIGEEYGGIGLSNKGYSRVIQETTRFDGSTSLTIGAHSSIGMKGLLLFGTDAQKKKYLPKLASGEMIAAFCLTEPGSGSDAGSVKTQASKNSDGSYVLNGEKLWITNGPIADFYTVFAKTDSSHGRMSAFIVERAFGGISNGAKEDKMGIRASATTSVIFQNTKIPAENLLGEEGMGFKVAMSILNNGRTGLGGGCVGGMKKCIELSTRQAKERKQFGKSISEFGLVKEKIAQMGVQCFATESVVTMVGQFIDSGSDDCSIEAAISKIFATESLWSVSYESLQIAGGNGFMKHFPYERITRDSRINMIFEGTNEILRLYVALSGMKHAGDYLKDIGKSIGNSLNDPIKGFGVFKSYASKKLAQYTSIGRARLKKVCDPLFDEALAYERYTLQLSKATEEALRRYGKGIVDQQHLMKRIADVTIDLFVGLCVLARVTKMVEEKSEKECRHQLEIARIFTRQAKRRINQNLRRLDRNDDPLMESVAEYLLAEGRYPWDIF